MSGLTKPALNSRDLDEVKVVLIHGEPDPKKFSPEVWTAAQFATLKKSDDELGKMKGKLQEFYKNQNDIILGLLETEAMFDDKHKAEQQHPEEQNKAEMRSVRAAVNASFFINIILFVLKIIAAIQSSSLSVIASALDSALDLLSGSILYLISRAARKRDPYKYPVSKSRLEPVGVIIFASVMGMASLQVLRAAVETLVAGSSGNPTKVTMGALSFGVLIFTIASKLILHLYCRCYAHKSDIVAALAQDHRNDVCTNTIGILGASLTSFVASLWWADSVGAMLLSAWIIVTWVRSGRTQVSLLVGKSAGPQLIGRLAFLAANHDKRIMRVDKVLAYHFGIRYMCEVDVVLPEDMPLREAHDIGEGLEKKIEALDVVERAFVHLDYEWTHAPEHKVIKL